ncbi:MAG TPA: ATP-binding protein [Gemmatimonadales bacterium]|nr:ATP-binding protein [Gemmatimonadales bacterium]
MSHRIPWPSAARWRAWLLWGAIFLVLTGLMRAARGDIGESHVALIYLLVVVGGSVAAGRALGFALACGGFLAIDYFFQIPYDEFGVDKPLDWAALLAFLATSTVTSELVTRALAEAEAARRRADEVARLSRLGSQALNAGRAEDALATLAAVIRGTLGVLDCEIYRYGNGAGPVASAVRAHGATADAARDDGALVAWVAEHGRAAVVRADGTSLEATAAGTEDDAIGVAVPDARTVVVPLQVEGRTVGVLRLADAHPMVLDAARRRFLSALAYYAALGLERVRLVAEAERGEALREADRLKDIVLASVSHDLRTPLTAIKALAQAAAVGGNENARVIEEEVDRLSRFVGDLLDLSRLKGGVFPVTLEPNTAEDVIGALTRQLQPLFPSRALTAAIDIEQPALVGRFDFVQTLRILSNLVENALRYSPPETTVELAVTRRDALLVFTVADRGPGIPPEDRDRIFEPFFRAAKSPPDVGRAGLGLSIARRLAQAQGGRLRHEPRPGGGSVFVLELDALDLPAPGVGDGS